MAWYDFLSAAPGSPQAAQAQGLFGGLQALGAGLAQAGQMRPVGQQGPGLAEAFLGFQRGQQQGLLGAYQQGEMDRKQRRAGLLAEAQSDKPDDQISPEARQIRPILSSLPPELRAFAGPDELPGLAIQRGTQRQRPMTPEELKAGGFRPGSVVMVNDFTGNPNVLQQPDYKSPEAEAQALRIAAAGRQPPAPTILGPGQVAYDRSGRPIAYGPQAKEEPLTPANAWNTILDGWQDAAAGKLDPSTPRGRRYQAAEDILTQPKPVQITQPDGSVIQVMQQPQLSFPRLGRPASGAAPEGSPPVAAPGAPPALPGAPATPQGMQVKPPPKLTEAEGNATAYLTRMQEAEKLMEGLVKDGYKPGGVWDGMTQNLPGVGNFLISEGGQNFRQAQEDWVRAKLRKESGASIAKDEMDREIAMYFPRPGDAASTIAQKAQSRRVAMDALRASTGGGMDRQPPPSTATSTPSRGADPLGLLK